MPAFQAFSSLMKLTLGHDNAGASWSLGTPAAFCSERSVRLSFTLPMWWLKAKRRAPAHIASRALWAWLGSRANL